MDAMPKDSLVRTVYEAAVEFDGRRFWEEFSNFDCFAARVPGEDAPVLGVVMGQAGEQFGLSLYRGPQAPVHLAIMQSDEGPGDDYFEVMDMVGFTMDIFAELPPEAQAVLREADLHPRFNEPAPHFIVKRPGHQPRRPDESELRLLLFALRGALQADQRGQFHPGSLDTREGVPTLLLGGDPRQPELSVTRERFETRPEARVLEFPSERPNLDNLPRLDSTWLVGLPPTPTQVEGDDRSFQLLLVVDDDFETALQTRLVSAAEAGEASGALFDTMKGDNSFGLEGLPGTIIFSSRKLFNETAAILEGTGVKCRYKPSIPKLRRVMSELEDFMERGAPPEFEDTPVSGASGVPAPGDLAGWKEADRRLARRFAECFRSEDRLMSSRAVKRYFGDDDLEYYFGAHEDQAVVMAYTAWGVLDYRPTKRSETLAEKMLSRGLPEAEARLLQARMEAHPTLYRVDDHDPRAGTIDMQDVLLGGSVTIHDQLMSENIDNGVLFAARACPAGRFHFVVPAGPPLGPYMGIEAVQFLQDCGVEFTRESLRLNARAFGWLWDWMDERQANWRPPIVRNTDGDDMVLHTGSFGVYDEPNVRRALLGREDIEHDPDADEFVWSRDDERSERMLGGPVTLGRIELVGDELIPSVNSAERFAKGREWLEAIDGVTFRGVDVRDFLNEEPEDRPPDETIAEPEPVEMTPELQEALQDMLYKQYMGWLDTPLPVLGGQTPREACGTDSGGQSVAMLIRTMADPMGPVPVRVPREAMLRELGLETGEPRSRRADADEAPQATSPPDFSPRARVGRNQPCPCGSGKKYKKCCGKTAG